MAIKNLEETTRKDAIEGKVPQRTIILILNNVFTASQDFVSMIFNLA